MYSGFVQRLVPLPRLLAIPYHEKVCQTDIQASDNAVTHPCPKLPPTSHKALHPARAGCLVVSGLARHHNFHVQFAALMGTHDVHTVTISAFIVFRIDRQGDGGGA